MDTIPESAATTLVRIEVLVLQGVLRTAILSASGVLLIPFAPFLMLLVRCRDSGLPWWKRGLMLPFWFIIGFLIALMAPFSALWKGLADTARIVCVEWTERWRNGTAKYPDGRQMLIPTAFHEHLVDVAITKGVIADYNQEARQHGQGIPPS